MKRSELEHAIRAACDVSGDTELIVIGSQSILAEFPNATGELTLSREVDIYPKNRPEAWEQIDAVLGELSMFHSTHGFYVHGVDPTTARLPRGWRDRLVPVRATGRGVYTAWCLEAHDLASSKLVIPDRQRDYLFVKALLREGKVRPEVMQARFSEMDLSPTEHDRVLARLSRIGTELESEPRSDRG